MAASVEKISVSLGAENLAWAKNRAARQQKSLSAVVSEALLRQRQAEAGVRLLEDLGTGDITEVDLAAIRAELGWAPKRSRPRATPAVKVKPATGSVRGRRKK